MGQFNTMQILTQLRYPHSRSSVKEIYINRLWNGEQAEIDFNHSMTEDNVVLALVSYFRIASLCD